MIVIGWYDKKPIYLGTYFSFRDEKQKLVNPSRYRLDQIGIDSFLKHNKMHFERVNDA